jgi:hypothetical protein
MNNMHKDYKNLIITISIIAIIILIIIAINNIEHQIRLEKIAHAQELYNNLTTRGINNL